MNVFAEDAALVGLGGVSKTEKGSDGSRVAGADAFVAGADSKKEKSASAQASMVGSSRAIGAEGGVLGLAGSGSCVLDVNAEKSSSSASFVLGSSTFTSLIAISFVSSASRAGNTSAFTSSCGMTSEIGFGGTSTLLFSDVAETERLAGFKSPGPIGPCSAWNGTKLFGPKIADVGDMVLRRRTICIASAERSWVGGVFGGDAEFDTVLSSVAGMELGKAAGKMDTVGLDIISPQSSSSSAGTSVRCS